MGELLMDMWAFMKERKKFWLFPIIMWLVSARRINSSYLRVGSCAVHLHSVLDMSRSILTRDGGSNLGHNLRHSRLDL